MLNLMDNPAWALYALSATIVGLQLIVLALLTGTARVRARKWVNPEDAELNKGTKVDADEPSVQRFKRAHQNLLENAVPFLVIGLLYVLTGGTKVGAQAYFGTFVAARLLHSVVYILGKQPWRTITFGLGVLATAGMAQHVLRAAL